jgi:Predicted metal-dependent enzyme
MKSSNIGGQAVLEGIMMKSGDEYAVAIRKPSGEIEVKKETYTSIIKWKAFTKIPFIRGAFNFVDSLVLGTKILNYSASFYVEEEEATSDKNNTKDSIITVLTTIVAFVFAIGIFMIVPYLLTELFKGIVQSYYLRLVIEAVIRLSIFVGYIVLISLMKDIKRLYMYHGAEHKCISCIETGLDLNVENVKKSSKEHKRCGTSFMLFVMLVGILLLFFIRVDTMWMRVTVRIALLPVIAGISYEIIKWAGSSDNKLVGLLSKPGLMLQKLTTKEPDEGMIEVAIQAVEAVFDWKNYQKEYQKECQKEHFGSEEK